MRNLLFRHSIQLAVVALLAGCSKQMTQNTAPVIPKASQGVKALQAFDRQHGVSRYIVVFKSSVDDVGAAVTDLESKGGFKATHRFQKVLKGFAGPLTPGQVSQLQNDPRVKYIEPDGFIHLTTTQTNPPSWGLDRIDQANLPLDNSYSYTNDGTGVDVYIVDCGISSGNSDFGGRVETQYGVDETPSGTTEDALGHGTFCAGVVGGASYGVAKGVHLIPIKVIDDNDIGQDSYAVAGLDFLAQDHLNRQTPAVASMSISANHYSQAIDDAVIGAMGDGVVACIASGNDGDGTQQQGTDIGSYSPADIGGGSSSAIVVAASDINDQFGLFSNYGSKVTIIAPGVNIVSDWVNPATKTDTGTSMAAPHASGVAALYLQTHTSATPAIVKAALLETAISNLIQNVPGGTNNSLLQSTLPGVNITVTQELHIQNNQDKFLLSASWNGHHHSTATYSWTNAVPTCSSTTDPNTAYVIISNQATITVSCSASIPSGVTGPGSIFLQGSHVLGGGQ